MKKMNLWSKIFWALVFANLMFAIIHALLHPYPNITYHTLGASHQQIKNEGKK